MKKVILYFTLLVVGNYLCIKFAFAQDNSRFIGLLGFLIGMISLFNFSAKFAGLFINRDFSFSELNSANSTNYKSLNKPALITLTMLIFLVGIHVWGYIGFFKYQDELLEKNGIEALAIITDKKWEKRGKNSPAEYYVYYEYKYQGKKFRHSSPNELKEIGDTLFVKLLPDNPDNHTVIKNKFEK
jgi:hypothetical protein